MDRVNPTQRETHKEVRRNLEGGYKNGSKLEERLLSLRLPILEVTWERGDLITVYKHVRGIELLDREDWFV